MMRCSTYPSFRLQVPSQVVFTESVISLPSRIALSRFFAEAFLGTWESSLLLLHTIALICMRPALCNLPNVEDFGDHSM